MKSAITLLLVALFAIMRVFGLQSNINQAREYRNEPKIYKNFIKSSKNNIYDISITMDYDEDILAEKRKVTITDLFFSDIQSRMMLMFLTIFVAFFVGSEWISGFIKNISRELKDRGLLVISKAVSVGTFLFAMFLTYYIISGIFCYFVFGYCQLGINFTNLAQLLIQYLLHFSFGIFIMWITYLVKSMAISIAIGAMLTMNILALFYSKIDFLIKKVFNHFTTIMEYTLTGNIAFLNISAPFHVYLRALLVSVFFFGFFLYLSYLFVKKNEI
ncbi:MAG: hypothetical protein LBF44_00005 [Holosporaceae bacterium]|jgi:hypothetical protein|nr:hypothetical protein [Holosporaceae bacterium]